MCLLVLLLTIKDSMMNTLQKLLTQFPNKPWNWREINYNPNITMNLYYTIIRIAAKLLRCSSLSISFPNTHAHGILSTNLKEPLSNLDKPPN